MTEAAPAAIPLPDERATELLGARIGEALEPGDLVALSGGIGAGKTTLARAILRAYLGDPSLEAPSPTFTLTQAYEGARGPAVHADLYRVGGEGELVELGFEDWRDAAAVLVEWPERAPSLLDRPRLEVALDLDPASDGRLARLAGAGPLAERVERARALDRLLERSGWASARRSPLAGDASSRLYERLRKPDGERAILMVSPSRPDGPPVRRGKPYSAIARLAESVTAFAAMDRGLVELGLSAPRILAEDLEAGLLLLEDLGADPVIGPDGPIPERYAEAVRLLADLHGRHLPTALPLPGNRKHAIPPFDGDAMGIEVELLLDWYAPHVAGFEPSGSVRAEFGHVWRDLLAPLQAGPQTWALRDYHSPNLLWLPERSGIARIGLLDFQDAVLGPPAYDVASLLQDARTDVPAELELHLLGLYAAERRRAEPGFDTAAFAASYAIMGAQRATKILGIFARLDRRDGKPQYLGHLPRIRRYLARNLAHPALARLRAWYERHLPGAFEAEPAPADDAPPAPAEAGAEPPAPAGLDLGRTAAMVLAAGLGQRMRPITDATPKPLVAVGGRALLDRALGRLAEAGIARAVVNVHHLADQIEAHLARGAPLPVEVSDERDALLETGGGVKRALPRLGDVFLTLNSDSIWTERGASNLRRLAEAWRPDEADALLLLAHRASLGYDGDGDFAMDADGRLARRKPGEVAPYVYAGVAVLKAALFDGAPEGRFSLNRVFDRAIADGRLYGLVLEGEWLHVGTPDAIGAAEERLAAEAS